MCELFSGHIVIDKEHKDFGKVYFLSGIHHEKDREEIYKKKGIIKLAAWTTKKYASFEEGFELTCSEGYISPKLKNELLKFLEDWAKDKDPKQILLSKFISVSKYGEKIDNFLIDMEGRVFSTPEEEKGICIDAKEVSNFMWKAGDNSVQITGNYSTQIAGDYSVQTAGDNSTQTARDGSTQTAGNYSTQTTGDNSTQTARNYSTQIAGDNSVQIAEVESKQTAGNYSTQTARDYSTQTAGDNSTQTAGNYSTQIAGNNSTQTIYGYTSYIILKGKNVTLRQIWQEGDQCFTAILNHDDLFKKYKTGDKLKIVKGKVVECLNSSVSTGVSL